MSYIQKINGVKHTVTISDDGSPVYDPPLDQSMQRTWNRRFREMLAHRKSPSTQSDTDFHRGRGTLLDQFKGDDAWCNHVVSQAQKYGYNPGSNDVYHSQLVRKDWGPGDPQAWVGPTEGRAKIKRICEERNLGCTGIVEHQPESSV